MALIRSRHPLCREALFKALTHLSPVQSRELVDCVDGLFLGVHNEPVAPSSITSGANDRPIRSPLRWRSRGASGTARPSPPRLEKMQFVQKRRIERDNLVALQPGK